MTYNKRKTIRSMVRMGKLVGISETVIDKIKYLYSLEYIKGMSNAKKNHVIVFMLMLIITVFTSLFIVANKNQNFDYFYCYLVIFVGSLAMLLLPRIWYVFSPIKLLKFKIVLCHFFTSLTIIIAIPIIISALLLRLCGLIKVIQYMEIFAVSFLMAIVLSTIQLAVLAKYITLYPKMNQIAVLLLSSFIIARVAISLMIKLMFYLEKKHQYKYLKSRSASVEEILVKENQLIIDRKIMNKEVNIIIYGLIALSTGIISLVNWDLVSTDATVKALNDGMLTALALYTAIEAIGDKWKDRMGVE
jgi:hypothetical protein